MKKIYTLLIPALCTSLLALAQQEPVAKVKKEPKPSDVTLSGGLSMPMGKYAGEIGQANTGFNGALDGNYYFLAGNRLGISVGFGYQQHKKDTITNPSDYIFKIKNGYTILYQEKNSAYRQLGFFIGPVYKLVDTKRWTAEVRLRAGVVNLYNPDFFQAVWSENTGSGYSEIAVIPFTAYDYKNSKFAFMPNLGVGINYHLNTKLALSFKADFYQGLGDNAKVGSASRDMKWQALIANGITYDNGTNNVLDFASRDFVNQSTAYKQSLNLNIGLQYSFHR